MRLHATAPIASAVHMREVLIRMSPWLQTAVADRGGMSSRVRPEGRRRFLDRAAFNMVGIRTPQHIRLRCRWIPHDHSTRSHGAPARCTRASCLRTGVGPWERRGAGHGGPDVGRREGKRVAG